MSDEAPRRVVNVAAQVREELTDRQLRVLDFIRWHHKSFGVSPSIREIGDILGIKSTNGVNDHLLALEKKGWIVRNARKARSIVIVRDPDADASDAEDRLWALVHDAVEAGVEYDDGTESTSEITDRLLAAYRRGE